jgi:hypothetical protein
MKRYSSIASVDAATGIVGATVIAAISLMQATVTNETESGTVALAAPSASVPVQSDLVFNPSPLPEIPVISDSTSPQSSNSQDFSGDAQPVSTQMISEGFATKAVVNATNGKVTAVESMNQNGVDAFAVTVKRTDGSVITGYVDRSSGDVYEWAVVKDAPAPVKPYEEEYEEGEYEEEEYEEGEYEEEEYEEEDERDNDDD